MWHLTLLILLSNPIVSYLHTNAMIQLFLSKWDSLLCIYLTRVRTSLPKLEVQRPSFKHVLYLLNWKSFGFWHENNHKDDCRDGDEYKYHECGWNPYSFCQGQKGLCNNEIWNPIWGRCHSSTDSSVSQRIYLRVYNPWNSSHSWWEE